MLPKHMTHYDGGSSIRDQYYHWTIGIVHVIVINITSIIAVKSMILARIIRMVLIPIAFSKILRLLQNYDLAKRLCLRYGVKVRRRHLKHGLEV